MASVTVIPTPARAAGRTTGPASAEDLFPLTPQWPIERRRVDRKIRHRMQSGEFFIRSQGTDLETFDIEGSAVGDEIKTLVDFYEDHALLGCLFRDAGFSKARDVAVQFAAPPTVREQFFNHFNWAVRLVKTRIV